MATFVRLSEDEQKVINGLKADKAVTDDRLVKDTIVRLLKENHGVDLTDHIHGEYKIFKYDQETGTVEYDV